MSKELNKAMELLRGLVSEIERQTCEHEETHRGGAIWEICDSCGAKWADDEGGKPEFEWPESVEKAREFLAAHPAVEQAGGDERAAFELFVRKHCGMPEHIAVNWDAKFTNDAWEGWQARAALAQPSPAQVRSTWPKLEKPAQVGAVRFSAGVSSRLVVEAAQRLYEFESTPEKEAERPEVVAWRYGFSGGIVSDKACLDEWKSGGEYQSLMTVAQHERIVEALRFERQQMDRAFTACINERDAANERADTLEHRMMGMMTRHFAEAWRNRDTQKALDGYLSAAIAQLEQERDAALAEVERLIGVCASLDSEKRDMEHKRDAIIAMRDAALARVAELEKLSRAHDPLRIGLAAMIGTFKTASNPGEESTLRMANQLFDATADARYGAFKNKAIVDRLIAGLAAPVAQAQHSVPEVSGIGRDFAYPRSVVLYLRTEPTDDDLRAIHDGLLSLAAAPGKEGA